jgi:outer membrane protein TolC
LAAIVGSKTMTTSKRNLRIPGINPIWLGLSAALLVACFIITTPCLAQKKNDNPTLSLVEAVRIALNLNADIVLSKEDVKIAQGALIEARGSFDNTLTFDPYYSREWTPYTPEISGDTIIDTTELALGWSKTTRDGITYNPTVTTDLYQGNYYGASLGQANVQFKVTVPLLKYGREFNAASEEAAKQDLTSQYYTLRHTTSQSVLSVVQAYWGYAEAKRRYDVLQGIYGRAMLLVKQTQDMIKFGEKAGSEIYKVKASANDYKRQLSAARQSLVDARHTLGLAMGLKGAIIDQIGLPNTGFPGLKRAQLAPAQKALTRMQSLAMELRQDLQAAKATERSRAISVRAAEIGLNPDLDLDAQVGYSGADSGDNLTTIINDFNQNVRGPNAYLGFSLSLPIENRSAKGALVQSLAQQRQQLRRTRLVEDNLISGAAKAYRRVLNGLAQFEEAHQTQKLYEESLRMEKRRLALGENTIQDVIDQQDNLAQAELTVISSQRELSNALAQLRYETGSMLVYPSAEVSAVTMESLTTIPHTGDVK